MKVFISGIAGFIGTPLANRLIAEGAEVVGLDDFSVGSMDGLAPEVNVIKGDITDKSLLWEALKDVDCVYHLAAKVSVPETQLYPRE